MALTSITKDFIVKSGLIVQGTTNPITTATGNLGTLQVNGGGAFAKDIMVASTATIFGPTNLKNILNVDGNVTVGANKFTIDGSNGNTYVDGNVGILGTLNSTGTFSVGNTLFTVDGISGDTYIDGNASINGNAGVVGTFNSTGTLSVNIDKFTVDGTTGNTHIQGNLDVTGTTYLSTLSLSGGLIITDTTNGGSGPTGALVLSNGGAYINKDLYIDGTTAGGDGTGALNVAQGGAYIAGVVYADSATGAGTNSGAIVVPNGGIYAGGGLQLDGTEGGDSGGLGTLYMPNGGFYAGNYSVITSPNHADNNYPALSLSAGGLYVNQDVRVDSTITAADSAGGTAALRVAGGVYIADNLLVKSTASDTGTNTSNALYVAGGAWIDKELKVAGDATFDGNVFFNGTATYVFSTNTYYTDNLIQIHTPPDGVNGVWIGDDGKDIGLRIHYYNGGDKNAALVLANDTHYLEWYEAGADGDNNVTTGTYGTFKTGAIKLVNTTPSTNTGTGALTVEGGVGIGGDVYVAGKIDVSEITSASAIKATVTTATNLKGGLLGEIPIQNADGSTSFIAAGTGASQVLTWNTATSTATWQSAASTTVGNATTATNIAGGAQYDVPFQSDAGQTTFDTGVFAYNDTDKSLKINDVTVWGDNSNAPGNADIQVAAATGLGVELYSDAYAQLNYNSDVYIYVNGTDGAVLETGNGDYTFTLDNSGNAILGGNTGGGYFEAPSVRADNLTDGRVVLSDSNHELTDSANLTFDGTNLTIGGSGGDITMSNGNITGVNHISATSLSAATLTATTALYLTSMTQGSALFVGANGEVSQDNTNFSWSVAGSQLNATNVTGATLTATTDLFLTALTQDSVPFIGANGQVSQDNTNFTWSAAGNQLHAENITGATLTATSAVSLTYATTGSVAFVNATGNLVTEAGFDYNPDGMGAGAGLLTVDNFTATTDAYIGGNLYVGGDIYLDGVGLDTVYGTTATFLDVISTGTVFANHVTATDIYVTSTATIGGDLYVDGTIYMQGVGLNNISASTGTFDYVTVEGTGTGLTVVDGVDIQGTTGASSTTSGALKVAGGVGIGENLHVGGDFWVTGTAHIANISINEVTLANITVNNTSTLNGPVFVNTTTQADGHGQDTGAIQIAGGLLAKKNIVAGGLVIGGDYNGGSSPTNPDGQTVDAFYSNNNMQSSYTKTGITGNSNVNLDVFDAGLYTTAKYLIQVTDSGDIHSTEILLIQDGTDAYITEYAEITTSGALGVFDAVVGGGNVTLKFTPAGATAMTIQVVRHSILTAIATYAV